MLHSKLCDEANSWFIKHWTIKKSVYIYIPIKRPNIPLK